MIRIMIFGILAWSLLHGSFASASSAVTIPVGSTPFRVAVNPTTGQAYVSNLTSNNVSVIDGATNTVVATVAVGTGPTGIDVNPITNQIYVANSLSNNISVIDGSSNTVVATITGMSNPDGIAVNSRTNQIFVANANGNDISIIDGSSNGIVATVPVGTTPLYVCVNSGTNMAYASNNVAGTISVINGMSDKVTKTFTLPKGALPGSISVDPKANNLFVTDGTNSAVYVLSAASGTLLDTITMSGVPFEPAQVAILQPGSTILISDYSLGTVMIASENTYAITGALKGGTNPIGIAVNQKTGVVYAAQSSADTVIAYSL